MKKHFNIDSTLVIMHSSVESNSFFGGMATSTWNFKIDPAEEFLKLKLDKISYLIYLL